MPHDANGLEIGAGDRVVIPGTVVAVYPCEEWCNCSVELDIPMPPYTSKAVFSAINTKQVQRVYPAPMDKAAEDAFTEVAAEYQTAADKHPAFASAHEGWAVILEEMDELWEEVRKRKRSPELMRAEAKQVAAMAIRFMVDLC